MARTELITRRGNTRPAAAGLATVWLAVALGVMQRLDSANRPALWLVPILLIAGVLSIWHYDGGRPTGTYLQAEITSYARRATGKSAPAPSFYAILPSGVGVFVNDWGELPATFRGPVVLEKQEGTISGKPVYKIDISRTSALHNK